MKYLLSTCRPSTSGYMPGSVRLAGGGLALALALAACAPSSSESDDPVEPAVDGATESAAPSGEPIKIGFIGALSGGSASLGVPASHGIELAVKHVNERGDLGAEIELIAIDDEADAATSATAAQRLITQDEVVAVLGGPNSGTVKANNPIITAAGIPNLITIAQEDGLVDPDAPGFDLTFRVSENNFYDVSAIATLFEEQDFATNCAIADTGAYGQGGIQTIQTVFGERGLTLAKVEQHEVNATDMTAQALSLRDAGCEAVYLFDLGQDAAVFMKTVKQIDWDVTVIGGRGLAQPAFLSIAGADANGIIFPSVVDPEKPASQEFIEAYDAEYGVDDDPAHVFSSIAYDSVMILAEALKVTGGTGGSDLADALEAVSIEGVSGRVGSTLGFTPDKHEAPSEDYLVFWQIEDGEYQFLTSDVESGQS